MTASDHKRALLIAGPTASGKSALALEKAIDLNGVVINADALQVYAPIRVLSARPTPEEEARVPHRLYGHVGAEQPYSVAAWLAQARHERALELGLAPVPEIPAELRARWRSFTGDLHAELAARDPAMAAKLLPSDRQRLSRALEVVDATGCSLLEWQRQGLDQAPLAGVAIERIFMDVPRDELYARAEARFDAMLEAGALDEARAMAHLDPMLPAMKAIGLPELVAHLRGKMTLEEASVRAKTATRNFIKRQLTWWRGQLPEWRMRAPPP
ncbi:MAG: tRNA (adenosine(37)-N6)-dimethylallyltransferase MiaA [Alphaproteobacteria bacterium]|nr:tRNA (adenosine(37)-N6)-dimethylallyltransferase MiaA [Alphaproteobacteria bacterium]